MIKDLIYKEASSFEMLKKTKADIEKAISVLDFNQKVKLMKVYKDILNGIYMIVILIESER